MSLNCPACGSEQVQKASVIFEAGTSQNVGHTMGTGVGVGLNGKMGIGFGSGTTKTTSKTVLAQRLSPPRPPGSLGCFGCGGCLFVIVFFGFLSSLMAFMSGLGGIGLGHGTKGGEDVFFGLLGLLIIGSLLIWRWRVRENYKARYATDLMQWHKLWFCHQCGQVFEPLPERAKG